MQLLKRYILQLNSLKHEYTFQIYLLFDFLSYTLIEKYMNLQKQLAMHFQSNQSNLMVLQASAQSYLYLVYQNTHQLVFKTNLYVVSLIKYIFPYQQTNFPILEREEHSKFYLSSKS
ncbi:hypothetical protein TTHERM_000885799 (macronuclear) [Tetrahymena thermophila SB210]|uniref:Uncharacterized protein n=1 Tax=Tetrahymena thermophila (strain SB210) TaxID=312017 RepID=W7XLN7_TETTS|nr:hypothetical protein TTHERM_000885799 [Tetrahymena thermophila SB210]EWS76609.1 hypothetical protein TTHERM_000885799 [Tetrahymena thermophila SB210]|eukprot:XP_012650895.1 hypothetical protein TTHERM_000885799 [Tetrahymena thermophila SB210]